MTIAELHGKISGTGKNVHERLEDLLTSDVFGSILYSEKWEILEEWFSQALNASEAKLTDVFQLHQIESVKMVFWPSGGRFGREPDVLLKIVTSNNESYGFCVEAKFLSGKSNVGVMTKDEDEDKEDQELSPETPPGDQLADQWLQIQEQSIPNYEWDDVSIENRALIFVTAHQAVPHTAFEETFSAFSTKQSDTEKARKKCFWLGWSCLHQVLAERYEGRKDESRSGSDLIIQHLYELLERKDLRHFRGYARCVEGIKELDLELNLAGPIFWNNRFFSFLEDAPQVQSEEYVFWRQQNEGK